MNACFVSSTASVDHAILVKIGGATYMTAPTKLQATRAFFGPRAAGWDARFFNDAPQYARAVDDLRLRPGMCVLDLGCGTGRALPPLRAAVGPSGQVVGLDATYEMLAEARRHGRGALATLLLGDALRLPFPSACADAIFAGGLLPHLEEPERALAEMARVTRPSGKLAVFHPVGRVALAARHGGVPSNNDVVAPSRLAKLCRATGWELEWLDDAEERYFALATRR
jgi:SAM-dependent methyltransferase